MNVTISYFEISLTGKTAVTKTYDVTGVEFDTTYAILTFYYNKVHKIELDNKHPKLFIEKESLNFIVEPRCPVEITFDNKTYNYVTATDGKLIENDLNVYLVMSQLQE